MDKKRVNEFGFGGEDEQALVAADSTEQTESTEPTEEEKKTNWASYDQKQANW